MQIQLIRLVFIFANVFKAVCKFLNLSRVVFPGLLHVKAIAVFVTYTQ